MVLIFIKMNYFSNYQKDRVYSLTPEGNGTVKEVSFESSRPVRFTLKTWEVTNVDTSSLQEENGVGCQLKEITKNEFDGFGVEWVWSPFGGIGEPIITL